MKSVITTADWKTSGLDVSNGVRPSSGAAMQENDATCEISETRERAGVAAAEDGRTPVNRYSGLAEGP